MTRALVGLSMRGWRSRWLTNLLTTLLIAVTAGAVVTALQLRDLADGPWETTFRAANGAHVIATGPAVAVSRLADEPSVVESSGPIDGVATALVVRGEAYTVEVAGLDAPPRVERPVITDGRWDTTGNRIILERSFAKALGLEVSDTVAIRGVDGDRSFVISGIAVLVSEAPYPDEQPARALVSSANVRRIQPDAAGRFGVQALRVDDPMRLDAIARQMAASAGPRVEIVTSDGRADRANFRNRATVTVLQAFSVVLLLAVSLVLVTLARSTVIERGEELGIAGVIGFTPNQRLAVLMVEHAVLSVVGAVLGAIGGSLLAPTLVRDSVELLGSLPVVVAPARVALVAAGVTIVSLLAALVPSWRQTRSRPITEPRGAARLNGLARRIRIGRPLPLSIAARQVGGRPARSSALVASLALTIGALVAGLSFEATVRDQDAFEQQQRIEQRADDGNLLVPRSPDPVAIFDSTKEQLRPIVRGANIILVGVAIVNLLASALIQLRRRRHDIALMRAIGFSPGQVRTSIAGADGLIGVGAAVIGVPFGTALFFGVYGLVAGATSGAVLAPGWQLAVAALSCIAAVSAISLIPAQRATAVPIASGLYGGAR